MSADEHMINAYKQGKDLYATIATKIYHNDYWDNMEHHEDGTDNPDGKKRRSACKGILLGIMYGMGASSLAETINETKENAQKIIDDFYTEFPKVKKWIDNTKSGAEKNGYVEDLWGRRRRLTDLQLPKYVVTDTKDKSIGLNFNPIIGSLGIVKKEKNKKVEKYETMLKESRGFNDIARIKKLASMDGVTIQDNGGFISRAERQCVNARIQGSAATMSKKAMIKVFNDDVLKSLGFHLMIPVHDEIIGECPKESTQVVANRLCELMKSSAQPECVVPFKCDPTIENVWYESDYGSVLNKEYKHLCEEMSEDEAFTNVCQSHEECTEERIRQFLQKIVDKSNNP